MSLSPQCMEGSTQNYSITWLYKQRKDASLKDNTEALIKAAQEQIQIETGVYHRRPADSLVHDSRTGRCKLSQHLDQASGLREHLCRIHPNCKSSSSIFQEQNQTYVQKRTVSSAKLLNLRTTQSPQAFLSSGRVCFEKDVHTTPSRKQRLKSDGSPPIMSEGKRP